MKRIVLILMGMAFMISSCSHRMGGGFPKTTVYEPLKRTNTDRKIKVRPIAPIRDRSGKGLMGITPRGL